MRTFLYITTLAIGASLTGCSSLTDDILPANTNTSDQVIHVTTDVTNLKTRAGHTASNIDNFGLIIVNSTNAAYNYAKEMIISDGNWITGDGQQMLWDTEYTPVSVTAYAPYKSEAATLTPFDINVLPDQKTENNVRLSDFLISKTMIDPKKDLTADGKLKVSFNHAMSKLVIKFTINSADAADMSLLSDVSVNGAIITGRCDMSSQQPIVTVNSDSAPATVSPFKSGNSYECIMVPQTISEGFSINFSYDGRLFTWTAPAPVDFQKGVEHTLILNINTNVSLAAKYLCTWAHQN